MLNKNALYNKSKMIRETVIVIGAGVAGLSAACHLAKAGYKVQVLDKNSGPGGRMRQLHVQGFVFDMGPSWYWMPDVFEDFFSAFGKKTEDYYSLMRLDPSYQAIWGNGECTVLPASFTALQKVFEDYEPGAGAQLAKFMKGAQYKYEVGMQQLVYKPGLSPMEYLDRRVIKGIFNLDLLGSMHTHLRRYFKHPRLLQLLEFPVLFLGATPKQTPALYSLMNYADSCLGTWYPKGGMFKVTEAMYQLAKELGVEFHFNTPATDFVLNNDRIVEVKTPETSIATKSVVAAADYHHVEQQLLPQRFRTYTAQYWESRKLAPSALIYYIGVSRKLPKLLHHNLFFDESFEQHAAAIYETPKWPDAPLFYACCPSKSDTSVAPEGCENLFLLIPVATGLEDTEAIKEYYYQLILQRLEHYCGENIRDHVIYKSSYAQRNFMEDYNSFKGNAYGLANTLRQTAILKPSLKSKKVANLYYAGQLTVPGPGVPPAIISGKVVATQLANYSTSKKLNQYESTI
jgi:phytoene desaturase